MTLLREKNYFFGMKTKRGYSLEQLDVLGTETELLLCGLIRPSDYPKELGSQMQISKEQVTDLVNEMNELVFKKIREVLMSTPVKVDSEKDKAILDKAGIEVINNTSGGTSKENTEVLNRDEVLTKVENPDTIKTNNTTSPALDSSQKLSGTFNVPPKQTEYSLNNFSKNTSAPEVKTQTKPPATYPKNDPYREIPE